MDEDLFNRIVDRYTAVELCDALDLSVERIIEAFYEDILDNAELLDELGFIVEGE